MIPLDGMADLPEKHKQKLMESMESMQAKDRHAAPTLATVSFPYTTPLKEVLVAEKITYSFSYRKFCLCARGKPVACTICKALSTTLPRRVPRDLQAQHSFKTLFWGFFSVNEFMVPSQSTNG
jgi:hypothetical protein